MEGKLYHEKQVAALCGVHCLNTLLQGPYFNEVDLAQVAHELDAMEREMLQEDGQAGDLGPSSNLDDSGMFSVQVLSKALAGWGLQIIPYDSQEVQVPGFDPLREHAFICNLQEHWFTIRSMDTGWWNFNSLSPAPEPLSDFYLAAFLDTLKEQGYTIFVVRGELPVWQGGMDEPAPGQWIKPEEARQAQAEAASARQRSRALNALEGAFARAGRGGGAISLQPNRGMGSGAHGSDGDDEDADLAAAIAASLGQQHPHAAGDSQGAGAGSGGARGFADFGDDEDPELAMALAASLADVQQPQQGTSGASNAADPPAAEEEPQSEQQHSQHAEVPDEPEAGPRVVQVAFRLPTGQRVARRFHVDEHTVGMMQAFVSQELQGAKVTLSTSYPTKMLDDASQSLQQAGILEPVALTVGVA